VTTCIAWAHLQFEDQACTWSKACRGALTFLVGMQWIKSMNFYYRSLWP